MGMKRGGDTTVMKPSIRHTTAALSSPRAEAAAAVGPGLGPTKTAWRRRGRTSLSTSVNGETAVKRARRLYRSGTKWCVWRWTDVDSEYITRLHLIKTPWFAICLHWINKPDAEPYLHDHPVSFLSVILRGW